MKILVIGGTGTIGQAIVKELSPRHSIIIAAYQHGDIQVDLAKTQSIKTMYEAIGQADAVVVAAGQVQFGPLSEMTEEEFSVGLQNKLMGQINVVLLGHDYLNDNGSFTLISGVLNRDPVRFGSSAATVNAGIDGFVKSAAIEMPRGIRINAVSPTVVTESMGTYGSYFRGFSSVSAAKVALAYSKSVEGAQTGEVYWVN